MRVDYCWLLELLVLIIGNELIGAHGQVSITPREPSEKGKEGSSVTFKWDFRLPAGESLREIVFGLWEKGYTSSYFITVSQPNGIWQANENPELSKKHPGFVGRVHWVGDISSSLVAFRLDNVRLSDNKTYGCQLGIGGFGQTIDSKIILIVESATTRSYGSVFVHYPSPRILAIVGEVTEFHWEYHLSDTDSKDVKYVQFARRTTPTSKPLLLWKAQNNVNTTSPEYAKRLVVSVRNWRSYKFKLSNVTRQDKGVYELKVVFSKAERELQRQVEVEVHERPRIINFKGPYKEEEQLFLGCHRVGGTQATNVKWLKNGRLIPHQTSSYYLINKLSASDSGVYACCAYYRLGNVSSLGVNVRVQYSPRILSPRDTKAVSSWKGNPIELNCSAVGDPPARWSWSRANGKLEKFVNASVLTITPSVDSDFTNYTCIARNEIGEDSRVFILTPLSPPSPPAITNIDMNYNALKVTWKAPSSKQDTPITGRVLRIRRKLEKQKKWNEIAFQAKSNYFILGNLTEGTLYSLRLYTTNKAGRSNASEEEVKTLKKVIGRPGIPRLHFTNVGINYTNYEITWDFPVDVGGAEVIYFTVWYREVATHNSSQVEWLMVNSTEPRLNLNLACCLTYEIMVTACNEYGPSFKDPDNAARVTVLRDIPNNTTLIGPDVEESGKQENSDIRKAIVKYLPYAGFLAIPALMFILKKSRIFKRTPFYRVKINDTEEPDDGMEEMEEVQTAPVPHLPSWEFPRCKLAIERMIGKGAFGVVSKAYARDLPDQPEWTTVAVKSLEDGASEGERRDLLSELKLLKKLKPHPHVIRLLGCITTEEDGPFVIIEYVPFGDLLGYLRRSRGVSDCYYDDPDIKPTTSLTSEQMLKFAWQISDGMRYISSKKIVHRDLAARNVLVGENHRCKITDFGMARDVNMEQIYVPRNEGRIPVKWTAIEAMTGAMKYSTQSDVWSFGVVLYEICTIGAEPYPGISPYRLPNVLLKGYRIPKPEYVKEDLYTIMRECWETEPEVRPTFETICNKIRGLEIRTNQNYVNIKDCLVAHEIDNVEITC